MNKTSPGASYSQEEQLGHIHKLNNRHIHNTSGKVIEKLDDNGNNSSLNSVLLLTPR